MERLYVKRQRETAEISQDLNLLRGMLTITTEVGASWSVAGMC